MNKINKNYKSPLLVAVVLISLTVLVTGCIPKASSETGVISEMTMTTAVDGKNRPTDPTNVFATDAAAFYCSFLVSGFPLGTKLEAQWIYLGGDPEVEVGEYFVAERQTATIEKEGRGYTYAVYERPAIKDYTWPKGDYKVVISVDGVEKGSTTFKVQ